MTGRSCRAGHVGNVGGPAAGRLILAAVGLAGAAAAAVAQPEESLARYFGFGDPRIIVVDDGAGPMFSADFDGDGLADLGIVNNRKSRIELYVQRRSPRSDVEIERTFKVNELPPSRTYDRVEVSVAHQVMAVAPFDVDGDGLLDLVYAGSPGEIVVLKRSEGGMYEVYGRRRVRDLAATRTGFAIADVTGDEAPELLSLVAGKIQWFPLPASGAIGEPKDVGGGGSGQEVIAFFVEDYDGDGMKDVLGAIPDDSAPLRLWRQQKAPGASGGKETIIGPELRFETPSVREVEPVRFPGRAAASIGVIERASRRIVFYDFVREAVDVAGSSGGEREATAEVRSFADGSSAERSVVVADIDGDGLADLIATNKSANQVDFRRQRPGLGFGQAEMFSSFKAPKALAVGQWDGAGPLEVFVLSEEEKTVGVGSFDAKTGRLSFPRPIPPATAGSTPMALAHVTLHDGPALAVVVRDKRDHTLELHRPPASGEGAGSSSTISLEGVKRPPQSMLPADIDHDGDVDLLLFTPGEPMVVVRVDRAGKPVDVLTDKTMPQFGLVQDAGPDNTALLDVTGDGKPELLIASKNFVRACAFDATNGWRVLEQITVPDAATNFTGLALMPARAGAKPTIVAADRAGGRIMLMAPEAGGWKVSDTLRVPGLAINAIYAGAFTGARGTDSDAASLLAISDSGFGVIRLAGERAALESFAAFRSDEEDRLEHEMAVGDVNGDGYVDVAVLDAQEQMCMILTFSASRKVHLATEFRVFESRLFSRGESREYEPSDALIVDLTGDGGQDLALLVHDRVIVFPQMTARE